jgi:hypothetical protein
MTVEEKQAGTAAALIPEFYYDLICRVPPGTLLAAMLWWELAGAPARQGIVKLLQEGKVDWIPFTLLFVALVGVGYSLGILISPLGRWVRGLYEKKVWVQVRNEFPALFDAIWDTYKDSFSSTAGERGGSGQETRSTVERQESKAGKLYRLMDDDLKAGHPQARVLLPKLNAEAALCENLAATAVAWCGIVIVANWGNVAWLRILWTLVFAAVFAWAGCHMYSDFVRRQFSFFRIVSRIVIKTSEGGGGG